MPRHCSAGGCKSRDNRETRNAGITFHKLPRGTIRRKLWITNSHRTDSWDPQTDFVYFCSRHFTPESFELTGCSGIRRLKEDAFPTVFEFSSTTRTKRAGIQQKREKVRKRSVAEEECHENIAVFSQELSGVEQLPQQEPSPSPPPESEPTSPSRYMRYLPPPPGFYLSKEHSYAQLCPLLWRRRYDQAVDCLEKALRRLHASRRRENRLRSTVTRLRDKQLKHTLRVSGDSNGGSWTPGGGKRRGGEGSTQEAGEDAGLFEDRCLELGDFMPDSKTWSEEKEGYCFYCGRGQLEGVAAHAAVQRHRDVAEPTRCVNHDACDVTDNTDGVKICKLRKNIDSDDSAPPPSCQCVNPATLSVRDPHEQTLLLADACKAEFKAAGQDHQLDQEVWIHGVAEGRLLLVPAPPEHDDAGKVQAILVSELKLEHNSGNSGGLSRPEGACEHFDITCTSAERREDVRDKLKEHVEGFQLQLSTEFLN